jgi:flagellar hook-length control protein FliK
MWAEMPAERTMSSEAAMPRLAGVEMARVIAKAGHSEMRIGLSTSAFGSVEVHTVVHADEVGVVIGSERGDLPGLIRSELPAISHNLQQQDVRLNQVNFQQQGFGFSAESQSGGHSQPRSFAAKGNFESLAVSQGASAESSPVIDPLGRPGTGLSILA